MDYAWPESLPPQLMIWSIQKAGVAFRSPYAGTVEAITFPGWYWKVSVTLKPRRARDGGEAEAFFEGLAGGEDAVLLHHWLRPIPRGTMRGAPTVSVAGVRGQRQIVLATAGTLLAGDLFSVGNTVHKARLSCSPVGGLLTVPLVGRLRQAVAVGAAVGWDRPKVRCLMPSMSNSSSYRPGSMQGLAIDLEEAPL
jgi:hypothetical protein